MSSGLIRNQMGRKVTVCVGVTPALQRTLRFSSLVLGDVNRCSAEPLESASGKATNVARVVRLLNHYFADLREDGTTEAVLVEFSGGETGKKYRSLLGFESVYVETKAATRICQTLLVDGEGEATELVEEAINPSEAEWSLFAETLAKQTAAIGDVSQCVGVLTGSPPPGSSPQIYKELLLVASAVRMNQMGITYVFLRGSVLTSCLPFWSISEVCGLSLTVRRPRCLRPLKRGRG
mmetsp:Transcript_43943/g.171677  ORF Transcript_43943/g.171677 Transcript_43943/m.171677 type:complete len:236 (-) Transcript_43943:813-1520(-)